VCHTLMPRGTLSFASTKCSAGRVSQTNNDFSMHAQRLLIVCHEFQSAKEVGRYESFPAAKHVDRQEVVQFDIPTT
jgi:hypothetical protein